LKNIYPIINLCSSSEFNEQFLIQCLSINPYYLQLRMKDSPTCDIASTASEIIKIRDRLSSLTKIIVNDDLEAAILSNADGVHLGQEDMNPATIKTKYPRLITGLSTHTIEQVVKANGMNVDYIGFGPVFHTLTKKNHSAVVTELARKASEETRHRIVFIGGISRNNIEFLPAGDKIYYALISGLNDFIPGEE